MPHISIIIPVYRVEAYLRRCVDSVLAQTYPDCEVILVDDGSPDGSGAICEEYAAKDARVRVIHKENGGLSSARNAGIDAAKGEYLFFVDSDDVVHPQTLETLLRYMEKNDADAAIGSFSRFRDDEELSFQPVVSPPLQNLTGVETMHQFFDAGDDTPKYVSSCGKLLKRTLFDGIRFPLRRLFEDEYTTYRLYERAKRVVVVDVPLYQYFFNDSGITGTLSLNKRFDEYDAQWERLEFFKEKSLTALYHKALRHFLHTAQWDLIACRERRESVDEKRAEHFQWQYHEVWRRADELKVISFGKNYDYYVLANPQKVTAYRLKRLALKAVGRFG
ncbi:MAG: glycosyltransferase family 2 protein [Clostridia bacterium]|nr:glycosyltransferase family 2 protein [Clostridia bacterium]